MKNRRLTFEMLESRTVLSAGLPGLAGLASLDSRDFDVRFSFELTDESGQARSAFETGERFFLSIYAKDVRADAGGIFAATMDLVYDADLMVLDGTVDFGPLFANGQTVSTIQPGILDEISACGGMTPPGPERVLFLQVPFLAVATGTAQFAFDPADAPWMDDVLVYGWDGPVTLDRIEFPSISIVIGNADADTVPVVVPDVPTTPVVAPSDPGDDTGQETQPTVTIPESGQPDVDMPSANPVEQVPPVDAPPVDTPPIDVPPVDTPPVDTPPVDTPPVDVPPVDTPPVDTPPEDVSPGGRDDLIDPVATGADAVAMEESRVSRDEEVVPHGIVWWETPMSDLTSLVIWLRKSGDEDGIAVTGVWWGDVSVLSGIQASSVELGMTSAVVTQGDLRRTDSALRYPLPIPIMPELNSRSLSGHWQSATDSGSWTGLQDFALGQSYPLTGRADFDVRLPDDSEYQELAERPAERFLPSVDLFVTPGDGLETEAAVEDVIAGKILLRK